MRHRQSFGWSLPAKDLRHFVADDFDVIEGRRVELAGRIQERYGVTREEAERQVKEWEDTF